MRMPPEPPPAATDLVGVVGLGDMGGAIARSLLDAGRRVVGFDPDPDAAGAFGSAGGDAVDDVRTVGERARLVITCLPSPESLLATLDVDAGLLSGADTSRRVEVVVEMSTFDLPTKHAAHALVVEQGGLLLDCPISGTAHQAPARDLVVYASGETDAIEEARPSLETFSRQVIDVGAFGDGSKAKYLANLLVGIHNAAAGEALTLATKSGMDPQRAFEAMVAGAGVSRMLEVRGPFMIEGDYRRGSSGGRTYAKDRQIIGEFARNAHCPVPLFSLASQLHDAAIAMGFDDHDSSAVCAASLGLAGLHPAPLAEISSAGSPADGGSAT
jgi:L-threonate 2-dehydrogenase